MRLYGYTLDAAYVCSSVLWDLSVHATEFIRQGQITRTRVGRICLLRNRKLYRYVDLRYVNLPLP